MYVCLQMIEMYCVVTDSWLTVQWAVSKFWILNRNRPEGRRRRTGIVVSFQFKVKFPYQSHYVRLSFRKEFENSWVLCPSAYVVYAHATASKLRDISNYSRYDSTTDTLYRTILFLAQFNCCNVNSPCTFHPITRLSSSIFLVRLISGNLSVLCSQRVIS